MPTNKNKPIDPNSPEFWKDFDPFEFDGPKDYVDGKSDAQVNRAHANRMKALNPDWKENQKLGAQKTAQKPEWRENQKLGAQKNAQKPEWRENTKLTNQKKALNTEWREKNKLANQQKYQDLEFRAKHKLAVQKACSKPISCDGVIFESGKAAAIALAPEKFKTNDSKAQWLGRQLKKFPNRYFYVTKSE